MDLDALRYANFSKLGAAITDWQDMAKQLEALKRDADNNLKAKAHKANWAGYNAQVSRDFIDKTAGEFGDAHTQAQTVFNILNDTYSELKSYQEQLKTAIDDGIKKNLTVMDTGDGTFTVIMNIHPDRAADPDKLPDHTQGDVNSLRDRVQKILTDATTSDTTAAKALQLIVDQTKVGFSDATYKDRDSAANALKAADDMSKLMNKNPHDLTNEELTQLNSYLKKYGKDPLFAEELATKVGPKKTLEFYTGIADPYQNQGMGTDPKARMELAKQLQKNLGITLGTATLSDSANMQKWEKDMINLGPERLDIDDADHPYGFQVMSALMRFGDYDDQFLNDYGNKLIDYDKEHDQAVPNHWISNATMFTDLNFYGEHDRGRDPMVGFLDALGHNPDASTQFFSQPGDDKLNDHLKYLTQERHWWSDEPQESHGYMAGQDALGHALEAATTGYSFDAQGFDPANPDHRNAATAGVMEQVVSIYGSQDGSKMFHDHPELADSMGKMGAAYIDDLDYYMSGVGNHGLDEDNFPAKYPGRADFGNQGAINFLSLLGQNKESHEIISGAQHVYTLSQLQENPPTDQDHYNRATDALRTEAKIRGLLDTSYVKQAAQDLGVDPNDFNKKVDVGTGWVKWGVGAVVGLGVAAIPGGEGLGAVVVPLAAQTVGHTVEEFIGKGIDHVADGIKQDPSEQAQMTGHQYFQMGSDAIGSDYDYYFKGHEHKADLDDITNDLNNDYMGNGPNTNTYRGLQPS